MQGGSGIHEGNIYIDDHPICSSSFGWEEADVVCRELGYNYTISLAKNSLFGDIPDWFLNSWTDFNCGGQETALRDCPHQKSGICNKDQGIGIVCSDSLKGKI